MDSAAEDEEWLILTEPDRLLAGEMLLTAKNGTGKVAFSLADLPLGVRFKTPCGHQIWRSSDNECKYRGRTIYVKPLEDLLGPAPKSKGRGGTTDYATNEERVEAGESQKVIETEQMIEAAERTAFKSHAAMQRMLQQTQEAKEMGANTLQTLHSQGQQIERIQDTLDEIDENHDRMEREMRSIESLGGQLMNYVTSATVKARNTNYEVDKLTDKEKKARDKQRKKEAKVAAKQKAKADKLAKAGKGKGKKGQADEEPIDSMEARLKAKNLPQELRVLSTDAQAAIIETDDMLDELSGNMQHLKQMAMQMGDEISDQNIRLDRINQRALTTDLRTRELDHKTKRMIG